MAKVLKTTFQLRRGYETAWEKNNPVLAQGEPGFVIDKNAFKIGDGATAWNDLEYISGGVFNAKTHSDFPENGFANIIYKAEDEKKLYQWNTTEHKYEVLNEIDISDGFSGSWNDLKDKPFGENETIIFPETLIQGFSDEDEDGIFKADFSADTYPFIDYGAMLPSNATFNVLWDGKVYPATSINGPFIGNRYLHDPTFENTGEPFYIVRHRQMGQEILTDVPGTSHTVQIALTAAKTIESKYIPDTVMKVEDLNNTTSFIKTEKQVLTPLQKLNGLNNLGILNASARPLGYYDLTFDSEGRCYTDEFAEYIKPYQQVGYRLWYHKDYKNHEYIGVYTRESYETHFEDFIDFGRFRIYSNCILDTEADYDEWSVTFELSSFENIIDQEYININNNFEIFIHYDEETNIDTTDQSYNEIIEAYEAGKHLIVITDNGYTFAPIVTIDPNIESIDLMSTFFGYIIYSDNTVEYTEYQIPTYEDIPDHTWESLPDKPFGRDVYTITNESSYFVPVGETGIGKISDMVVPRECLVGTEVYLNDQKDSLTQEIIDLWVENGMITDDFALLGDFILMIYTAGTVIQGLTFPEIGTYSVPAEVLKVSITWEKIKTLDPKYLPDISETVDTAVTAALTEAKESGEFDGAPGTPGADGKTPIKGTDYYTEADKTEMVNRVLSALPTWTGGSY